MDFKDLLKKIMNLLETKKRLAKIIEVEKKSQRIESLIEKCNYKAYISFIPNHLIMLYYISIYQLLNFLAAIFIQMSNADYELKDKMINHLTEMMKT